jgi:aminoglycoside phosphotransferase (APT) family kinase protein
VTIDGRYGYVFDRVDGVVMLDLLLRCPWRGRRYAGLLASVHADMHGRRFDGLPEIKARLAAKIDAAAPLDRSLRTAAKHRLLELEAGNSVLHGDLHPDNVMLTKAGPVVIDWTDAAQGSPAADVARTEWLFSAATIPPEAPHRSFLVAAQSIFRRRYVGSNLAATGMSRSRLRAWRLPVLAGRLSEAIDRETEPVLIEIRSLVD